MLLDRFSLKEKVAIVTGAGRGIGRGIALGLAEAGASVVCASRTQSEIDDTVAQIEALGSRGLALAGDVNDAAVLEGLVAGAVESFGGLDIVINNAGGSLPGLALYTSAEEFEAAFHFNCTTAFVLSQKAMPHLLDRPGAAIVNVSSALSHLVDSGFVAYGTAKAALSHMTRLLAHELAPRIRVNAMAVGAVETGALAPFLAAGDLREKMVALTPMDRLGTVEDIAVLALYLASPASAWVTGKVFEIDGGTVASSWPAELRLKPF